MYVKLQYNNCIIPKYTMISPTLLLLLTPFTHSTLQINLKRKYLIMSDSPTKNVLTPRRVGSKHKVLLL